MIWFLQFKDETAGMLFLLQRFIDILYSLFLPLRKQLYPWWVKKYHLCLFLFFIFLDQCKFGIWIF